jgi:hypothetical protein
MVIEVIPQPSPQGHWVIAGWQGCDGTAGDLCFINAGATTSAPFQGCRAASEFTLDEGPYNLRVRATDRSGNVATTSPQAFQIIDTQLLSGPPDFHAGKAPTFRFATLAGFSFDCSLDSTTLVDCGNKLADGTLSKAFADLPEGTHTFRVRARNGADFDHVPVERTWTVDTVSPDTSLDVLTGPPEGVITSLLTANFAFAADEPASFQCQIDGQGFAPCSSPVGFGDLAFGPHSFQARARSIGPATSTPRPRRGTGGSRRSTTTATASTSGPTATTATRPSTPAPPTFRSTASTRTAGAATSPTSRGSS